MPFTFSREATEQLLVADRCIEDRRNNPVRGRTTRFRLLQQNILAYTFPFVPGFTQAGINGMPFATLISQPLENALEEGRLFYRNDFSINNNAVAKVAGDIFEKVEAAIHWNAAARWNQFMVEGEWRGLPRYVRPTIQPAEDKQVVALSLPRRFDWVRLLTPEASRSIGQLRQELEGHNLSLPTSTPDLLIARLPSRFQREESFRQELEDLGKDSQALLDHGYRRLLGELAASDIILAIALKKSLRSDRLYQPLYEANIMQLLLEGRLNAVQVDFEVHTLESAGTRARETYRAASLALVATAHAHPHRAVRELYEPTSAGEVVRRFLAFLNQRMTSAT